MEGLPDSILPTEKKVVSVDRSYRLMGFGFDGIGPMESHPSLGSGPVYIWSNYSDLTRPHPKWWFSKGTPLISGKSRLVKYYNLARYIYIYMLISFIHIYDIHP